MILFSPKVVAMDSLGVMLGGGGRGWLEAALLVGLNCAALAHPDRIRSVTRFRIATLLLGVSSVLPVIIQLFLVRNPSTGPGMNSSTDPGAAMFILAISPIVTMLAEILGVGSVTPRSQDKTA